MKSTPMAVAPSSLSVGPDRTRISSLRSRYSTCADLSASLRSDGNDRLTQDTTQSMTILPENRRRRSRLQADYLTLRAADSEAGRGRCGSAGRELRVLTLHLVQTTVCNA